MFFILDPNFYHINERMLEKVMVGKTWLHQNIKITQRNKISPGKHETSQIDN